MRKVTCRCEHSFEVDLPEEIDLDRESGRIDDILEGRFFTIICPKCGTTLKPELRVRFKSQRQRLDFTVLPELERLSFYLGQASIPPGSEILVGYSELFERAHALKDGFDAEVLEILKYYLRAKAEEEASESAQVVVAYAGRGEDGRLRFHVRGLREGEVAVLPLALDRYTRILAEKEKTKSTEPFDRIFKGPYKSLRTLEFEED